jgi:hypothetical protein
MNDATTRKIDSPRAPRAERGAAAVVAQYIHELSSRHAANRHGSPALEGHPRPQDPTAHRKQLGAPTRRPRSSSRLARPRIDSRPGAIAPDGWPSWCSA